MLGAHNPPIESLEIHVGVVDMQLRPAQVAALFALLRRLTAGEKKRRIVRKHQQGRFEVIAGEVARGVLLRSKLVPQHALLSGDTARWARMRLMHACSTLFKRYYWMNMAAGVHDGVGGPEAALRHVDGLLLPPMTLPGFVIVHAVATRVSVGGGG